jgi:hypothetical protein
VGAAGREAGGLTALEWDEHVAEWKAMYLAKHPEKGHGKAPGAGRGKKKPPKDAESASLGEEAAKATGKAERTVQKGWQVAEEIPQEVRDAIRNTDAQRAIEIALKDSEWGQWADRDIARLCGVTHPTVGKYRASLVNITSDCQSDSPKRTYRTKHGTKAKMRTKNGVDHKTVAKYRSLSKLDSDCQSDTPKRTYRTKQGTKAKMRTKNIGRKKKTTPTTTAPTAQCAGGSSPTRTGTATRPGRGGITTSGGSTYGERRGRVATAVTSTGKQLAEKRLVAPRP